jgi:transcriptional antiterminator NusG
VEKVQYTAEFKVGETVMILEGPFAQKEGKVVHMDYDKGIAVVTIEMFGRYIPAEVEFTNAKSIKEY